MKSLSYFVLRAAVCALALCALLPYPPLVFAGDNITVQVFCKIGVNVANAEVKIYRVSAKDQSTSLAGGDLTDKNGFARIKNVAGGSYELVVVCPSGETFKEPLRLGGAADESHSYLFRCCPWPPGAPPPSRDGLVAIDGKPVTDDVTAGSRVNVRTEVTVANGLKTVKFDTINGRVIVNLPDDMKAGDTISGTVIAEPKGETKEERAKNLAVWGDYFYVNPGRFAQGEVLVHIDAATQPFTVTVPDDKSPYTFYGRHFGVDLKDTKGQVMGTATVPLEIISLSLQSVAPLTVPQLPTIGQQGRPVEIYGPFDGNSKNTVLHFTGAPFYIGQFPENETKGTGTNLSSVYMIAESPRKCVFEAPTNVTGPIELYLKEGNKETKGTYRNVGVNLTAPKTNLLKGESTELHVEVTGLQGIKQPVPLTLESHGVITMAGGMYQPLVIQPSQVGADGRYSTTRGVTGVQAGVWGTTATVVTHRFDFCLQDDSNPRTVVLVNSFTGNYLFTPLGGTSLSGTGTVTRKGCIITLTDRQPDRSVQGTIDPCARTGSASVTVSPKIKFTIIDRNTANNTCAVQ